MKFLEVSYACVEIWLIVMMVSCFAKLRFVKLLYKIGSSMIIFLSMKEKILHFCVYIR